MIFIFCDVGFTHFSDANAGRGFILPHFNVTSIPPASFFTNKLNSISEELPDEDIFICFMCVAFSTFLCPNSSLHPAPNISISSEIVAPRWISIYLGLSMSDSLAVLKSLRILQRLLPRDQSQMAAVTMLELWLISFLLFPFYAASFVYCYLIIFSLFFC